MSVKFNREALAEALKICASVAPKTSARPTHRMIMVSPCYKNHGINLHATDGSTFVMAFVESDDAIDFASCCIPASTSADLVGRLDAEEIALSAGDNDLTILCAGGSYTLPVASAADFPGGVGKTGDDPVVVQCGQMAQAIERVAFAAAKDQGRYAINGVYIEAEAGRLTTVATDGRRLAMYRVAVPGQRKLSAILPVRDAQLLAKLFASEPAEDTVAISTVGRSVVAEVGSYVLEMSVVEGQYPKYGQVIPKHEHGASVSKEPFLAALAAAECVSSDVPSVTLDVGKDTITVSSACPDRGSASVQLDAVVGCKPMRVQFNPRYLIDGIRRLESETVSLRLGDMACPVLICDGTNSSYVVMPINERD